MHEHTLKQSHTVAAPAPFTSAHTSLLQRRCACGGTPGPTGECAECRKKRLSLQRKPMNQPAVTPSAPPIVHDVLRSPGQPLDPDTRAFMEGRFGHADLKSDESKKKFRTYLGATTLMQVTPAGNYKGHCTKEYLTEVANTCPARFSELRTGGFCTGDKCLEFDRWGSSGDAETGKMVTDGPDTFIDRHRTRHDQSLLEGTGKDQCSVVCHQRYKYDRKDDLGSFYIIRNFRAGKYTPPGSKDALHITTGEVQKVPAALEAPSSETFAKDVAPGLKKGGSLAGAPPVPKDSEKKK